ncbi:MAG TPA: hypothetical protein VNZ61_21985 [Roseomonas sp.]|nr:hypothetical protein [Roseomonas sp.]
MSAASTSLSAKSGDAPNLPRFVYVGTDAEHGRELWVSDGTGAGTTLLQDIWPGSHGADISNMIRLPDGRILFTAQDPEHGYELWVTDGTTDGTSLLYDINDGNGAIQPGNFAALSDGRVAFVASNTTTGSELWVTDGTRDGTHLMLEMTPGTDDTRFLGPIYPMTDGRFMFGMVRDNDDSSGLQHNALMVSDGTLSGTVELSGYSSYPSYDGSVLLGDGRLIFRDADQLKVTDGTLAGTHAVETPVGQYSPHLYGAIGDGMALLSVLAPGATDYRNSEEAITHYVTDGVETRELLKTDLTGKGTMVVPLGDGNCLFWVLVQGERQLILTDGTDAGFRTLSTGSEANLRSILPLGDGQALLLKVTPDAGRSLVLFDGTGMTEIMHGDGVPEYLSADDMVRLSDGTILFAGTADGYTGVKVWRTDGTAEGTHETAIANPAGSLSDHLLEIGLIPGQPGAETPDDPILPDPPIAESPHHQWSAANVLFDSAFYLEHNPDVAAAGVDPLQHFLAFGATEERDPNSHFDISFYLNQNPDVAAAGINALEHYMTSGGQEGRAASFAFDGDAYLAANDDVAKAGMNPLEHYLHFGEAEHRDAPQATPHATRPQNVLVDASFYFSTYADVAREGVDPTQHFMASGWQEGRDPNAFFDTDWYLAHNPDVASAHVNPLEHYLAYGAAEGRAPGAAFDGEAYLAHNPDVAAAGMNPLAHYLAYGAAEHRDVFAT